jgi:hypothetical protein
MGPCTHSWVSVGLFIGLVIAHNWVWVYVFRLAITPLQERAAWQNTHASRQQMNTRKIFSKAGYLKMITGHQRVNIESRAP